MTELWLAIWLLGAWHREAKTWPAEYVTMEWFAENARPPGWHNPAPQPAYPPGGWVSHGGAKFFDVRRDP